MAHRTLSRPTVTAGVAVALLLAALMAAALSSERPAAADEHDDGLGGAVDDVVDTMADDEEDGEQEAADGGQTQEVEPENGGGGGQEPAAEEPPAEEPAAQEPAPEPSGDGGGQEPAGDQAAEQQSGGSAPVPSGPRTAAGPRLNPSAGLPDGEREGATFDFSGEDDMFASAPEVFTEDGGDRRARRPDELALASLPRENGPANAEPTGGVPTQLVAAATGLLVTVGVGHVLHATRPGDDELWDDEPGDDGDGGGDGRDGGGDDGVEGRDEV